MSFPGWPFSNPSDRVIANWMSRLEERINSGPDAKRLVDGVELTKKRLTQPMGVINIMYRKIHNREDRRYDPFLF